MIEENFLYFCCGVAGAGVLCGNRPAIALLLGVALTTWVVEGVYLSWHTLFTIDMVIAAMFMVKGAPRSHYMILGLFPMAWIAYALPPPYYYWVPYYVVCLQLLLCVPLPWLQRGIWNVSHGPLRELNYGGA